MSTILIENTKMAVFQYKYFISVCSFTKIFDTLNSMSTILTELWKILA